MWLKPPPRPVRHPLFVNLNRDVTFPRRLLLKSLLSEAGWLQSTGRKKSGARAAARSQTSCRAFLLPVRSILVHALQLHPHRPDFFSQTNRYLNPGIWPAESVKSRYPGRQSCCGDLVISIDSEPLEMNSLERSTAFGLLLLPRRNESAMSLRNIVKECVSSSGPHFVYRTYGKQRPPPPQQPDLWRVLIRNFYVSHHYRQSNSPIHTVQLI